MEKNNIITRFAPSPTGYLHIGNARTALVSYLYARKNGGKFMLRMDDTDLERSKEEYVEAIHNDLRWLGLDYDVYARQSERNSRYEEVKNQLIINGFLYPCFETQEELEFKRKILLSRNKPPIYDRSSLKLSKSEIDALLAEGKSPHYRFKLNNKIVKWLDLIKDEQHIDCASISDPVIIRADGSLTYILSSVIDDMDFAISHVIRGEDHVSNTAVQIQIFEALGASVPYFAHLALMKTKEEKISKRFGGYDIASLREKEIEAMAICSMLAKIGTSKDITISETIQQLIDDFSLDVFSKSPANYNEEDLYRLNHQYLSQQEFADIKNRIASNGVPIGDPTDFNCFNDLLWHAIKGNIHVLSDVLNWWQIITNKDYVFTPLDSAFSEIAVGVLPEDLWDLSTWQTWTNAIKEKTGKSGKDLYMPLRKALTGMDHGPELKYIMPFMKREVIIHRLTTK